MNNYHSIEHGQNSEFHGLDGQAAKGGRGYEPAFGGAADLILINGHLPFSDHIPVSRCYSPEFEPKNWFRSVDGFEPKQIQYVAKIQHFKAGGYEVVVSPQDMHKIAGAMDCERRSGVRVQGEQDELNVQTSIQRSKRKVRHLVASMGCDRMLTLTIRESDPDKFLTVEQWKKAWDRFNRMLKKAGAPLDYVAVLETHEKGNYHLHAAIVGRANIKLMRRIWFICLGGRGDEREGNTPGNVRIDFKPNMTSFRRRSNLAKYVSKYLAKQAGHTEFNKKRYWSSKHKLPDVIRVILNSDGLLGSYVELAALLSLSVPALVEHTSCEFDTINGSGFWFSYDEGLSL